MAHNYNTGEEVKTTLDYVVITRPQVKLPSGKESSHSLATDAVRRAQQAHNYNTGGSEGKAKLDYVATTRPQVKLPSGRQKTTQHGLAVPSADEDPPSSTTENRGRPPLSGQTKYSSKPTTTRRRLSTRLSARALELKVTHSRQYVHK